MGLERINGMGADTVGKHWNIPRNHKVEDALNLASEKADLTLLHSLLNVLADPYIEGNEHESYTAPHPPDYGRYQTFCGT